MIPGVPGRVWGKEGTGTQAGCNLASSPVRAGAGTQGRQAEGGIVRQDTKSHLTPCSVIGRSDTWRWKQPIRCFVYTGVEYLHN